MASTSSHLSFPRFILVLVLVGFTVAVPNATDPFYPCKSYTIFGVLDVDCIRIPVRTVQTVFNKFNAKYIKFFHLVPNVNDSKIIANVTGNNTIGYLTLSCPNRKNNPLVVDPDAFKITRSVTKTLYIESCDLRKLDWSFLKGFSGLTSFYVQYCSNFHVMFYTLPSASFTKLSAVYFNNILGMEGFNNKNLKYPAPVPRGLTKLYMWYCADVTDTTLDNLLKNWFTPTSATTLSLIHIGGFNITRIPREISKYTQLNDIVFAVNYQPWIMQPNSFNFSAPVSLINIDTALLTSISPGAFIGLNNLQSAYFVLYRNQLKTLNSAVFKPILQQMISHEGYVELFDNPIDCSVKQQCGLAWLIRDNPVLLNVVWSAQCSNGTFLYDLNPKALVTPCGKKCP